MLIFCLNESHYKSNDVSLAVIILLLVINCHAFSQYSVRQTMLLQELFENHIMPYVEAAGAAGRVLRMTGDAIVSILSYS